MPATLTRLTGSLLEDGRHLLVLPLGGKGKVPGPLAGEGLVCQRLGERLVRPPAGRRRRTVVNRGSYQRVPELNPETVIGDQASAFRSF
jgi:hypothetical protein